MEHLRPEYPSERSRRVEHADHVPEPEDPVNRARQAVRRAQGPVNYRDLTGQPGPMQPAGRRRRTSCPSRRRGAAATAAAEPPTEPEGPPRTYGPDLDAPPAPMPEHGRPGKRPLSSEPPLAPMDVDCEPSAPASGSGYSQADREAQLAEEALRLHPPAQHHDAPDPNVELPPEPTSSTAPARPRSASTATEEEIHFSKRARFALESLNEGRRLDGLPPVSELPAIDIDAAMESLSALPRAPSGDSDSLNILEEYYVLEHSDAD